MKKKLFDYGQRLHLILGQQAAGYCESKGYLESENTLLKGLIQ